MAATRSFDGSEDDGAFFLYQRLDSNGLPIENDTILIPRVEVSRFLRVQNPPSQIRQSSTTARRSRVPNNRHKSSTRKSKVTRRTSPKSADTLMSNASNLESSYKTCPTTVSSASSLAPSDFGCNDDPVVAELRLIRAQLGKLIETKAPIITSDPDASTYDMKFRFYTSLIVLITLGLLGLMANFLGVTKVTGILIAAASLFALNWLIVHGTGLSLQKEPDTSRNCCSTKARKENLNETEANVEGNSPLLSLIVLSSNLVSMSNNSGNSFTNHGPNLGQQANRDSVYYSIPPTPQVQTHYLQESYMSDSNEAVKTEEDPKALQLTPNKGAAPFDSDYFKKKD